MRTADAARVLGVNPGMLRMWEQQYDFPLSMRDVRGHRSFMADQIAALSDELLRCVSVSAAIAAARRHPEVSLPIPRDLPA